MNKKLIILISLLCVALIFTGCTRRRRGSGNKTNSSPRVERAERQSSSRITSHNGKTVIKMRRENGVYFVPCKINDVDMEFIFDTGASDITMSLTEVFFLSK